jgi:hypothetical protein
VSELRIRSEAFVETPVIDSFVPLPIRAGSHNPSDLAPLIQAAGQALAGLLGHPVQLVPATEDEAEAIEGKGGRRLAALFLTTRLGGDPARALVESMGGEVLEAYHARLLAGVKAGVQSPALWPRGVDELPVTVLAAGLEDGLWLIPPLDRPSQEVRAMPPHPRMLAGLGEVPMRLRVELAAMEMPLAALLPLHVGQVIPISPATDMALRMEAHGIGRVTLSSRPDGRQEALLVGLDITHVGGRS